MPSGDLRRDVARFNNYPWFAPMSGNAFSARVLRRIMPMPERPFRLAADYYLVRAASLCGRVVSLDEIGGLYRRHTTNSAHRREFDLGAARNHIELIEQSHASMKAFTERIAFTGYPSTASDAADLLFYGLRMASLRLDPAAHPIASDRLLPLARRGMAVALRQSQRSASFRCAAAAWFAAMVLAPRSLAWPMSNWFLFPYNRPPGLRPKLTLLMRPS